MRSTSRLLLPLVAALCVLSCGPGEETPGPAASGGVDDPAYATRLRRAESFWEKGQARQAREEIEAAIDLAPDAREPYERLSRYAGADAVAVFGDVAGRHPESPAAWAFKGHHEAASGDWSSAEASWRRALALDPAYPDGARRLGQVLSTRGDFAGAADAFRAAWRANPGSTAAAATLVRTLRVAARDDEADAVLAEALATGPPDAELLLLRAASERRGHRLEAAVVTLNQALEIDPLLEAAYRDLAAVLFRLGNPEAAGERLEWAERVKDYRELTAAFEEQIALLPRDGELPLLRGELALSVKREDEALAWLERARRNDGNEERVAAAEACAWFSLGDRDRGDAALSNVSRDSGDPRVWLARAWAEEVAGRSERAVEWLRRAAAEAPRERTFLRRASDLFERLGFHDEAREARRRAATASLLPAPPAA